MKSETNAWYTRERFKLIKENEYLQTKKKNL